MKIFFLLFTFFVLTFNVFSFDMILVGDEILEDIRFLSLKTGIPFLSFSPPLAPAEVRRFLDSIDDVALSNTIVEDAYNRIRARLSPVSNISYTDDNFSLLLDIHLTFEAFVRFNTNIQRYPRYPDIIPFVSLPLRASFANTVQLYLEPIYAYCISEHGKDRFNINIPFGLDPANRSASLRGFLAAGGDFWNFQIGRDRLFWGTGHTGSLIFSDNSQYFDFARLSFFSTNVKYSAIVTQLPLQVRQRLFDLDDDKWNANRRENDLLDRMILQRYYYLHRLDFRLFNRVSIGLMEGLMVGNSPFELRYLNPLIIFHDLFSWYDFDKWRWGEHRGDMVGSLFSMEVNWNVLRNLAVYGQFVMNELTLPGETNENPNAMGYMLGVQYAFSFTNWRSVSFLEFFYTDPYLSILSSPFGSFIQMDYKQYYFIGYPRDTIAVIFGTNFYNKDTLNFAGRFSWIASGQHNDNESTNGLTWDWREGPSSRAPTGTVEHKLILSLGAGWRPLSWLTFNTKISGIVSLNNNHISGDNQIGGQVSFSAGLRY